MDESKITVCQATVVSNEPVAENTWKLVLAPEDHFEVTKCSPGQFVCLEPLAKSSTMSRPFSISIISTSRGTFSIMYKVVGENTKLMCQLKEGQKIKLWGPLGSNEVIEISDYDEVWLVGGGIGIAPLRLFDKVITEYQDGKVKVFYGNVTKTDIVDLNLYTDELLEISTDDGTAGYHGLITDLLAQKLLELKTGKILVLACGPNAMMQKTVELCQQVDIDCYVILEQIMACGIGSCLGCSIKTKSGMKRVCHDGPIFNAKEVIWDERS